MHEVYSPALPLIFMKEVCTSCAALSMTHSLFGSPPMADVGCTGLILSAYFAGVSLIGSGSKTT